MIPFRILVLIFIFYYVATTLAAEDIPTNVVKSNMWNGTNIKFSFSWVINSEQNEEFESKIRAKTLDAITIFNQSTDGLFNFQEVPQKPDGDQILVFMPDTEMGEHCGSFKGHKNFVSRIAVRKSPCSVGSIMHEILHALGFKHEHVRPDRDQYVQIKYKNIIKKYKNNFAICKKCMNTSAAAFASYDYSSIMHYPVRAFSKNKKRTIIPLLNDSGEKLGQRSHLSDLDVLKIKALFGQSGKQ